MNNLIGRVALLASLLFAATLPGAAQYTFVQGNYMITSAPSKLTIESLDGSSFAYPRADGTEMRVKLFDAALMTKKKWTCVDDLDEREACYFHAGAGQAQTTPCEADDWETFIETLTKCKGGCWVKVFVKEPTPEGLKDERGMPIAIIKVAPEECQKLAAQYK